jgi:hypothetical protein
VTYFFSLEENTLRCVWKIPQLFLSRYPQQLKNNNQLKQTLGFSINFTSFILYSSYTEIKIILVRNVDCHYQNLIKKKYLIKQPNRMAAQSDTCTVSCRSYAGIVGWNCSRGMEVCLRYFRVVLRAQEPCNLPTPVQIYINMIANIQKKGGFGPHWSARRRKELD